MRSCGHRDDWTIDLESFEASPVAAQGDIGGRVVGEARTDAQVAQELRGLQMVERIREALEDRFEVEVREAVASGVDHPVDRLHDYLTGVSDAHEPRVRLLFELHDRGALDLSGVLADVPETCFFLGDAVRLQRSLDDWLSVLGPVRTYASSFGVTGEVELFSAGDLVWLRSRERAQAAADYLALVLDRPVGVWRATAQAEGLRVLAADRWSGAELGRVVVAPDALDVADAERLAPGEALPTDRALTPRPRVVDEL